MSAAAPAPAPLFDLKSTAWTLPRCACSRPTWRRWPAALDARFGDSPGLFDGEGVAIDLAALREADAELDMAALLRHLRRHGMLPVAAMGGSPAQMAAARAAGLAEATEAAPSRTDAPREVEAGRARRTDRGGARGRGHPRGRGGAPGARRSGGVPPLVVDKPLRSGQRVYARGGDLVVLAAVSFGAEVIADGNIHVYAPLRGRAIAGARGECPRPHLQHLPGAAAGLHRRHLPHHRDAAARRRAGQARRRCGWTARRSSSSRWAPDVPPADPSAPSNPQERTATS
jgi:septum site-determining protein MinC